ncbi:MAG: DMT family transporter [Bacteroidales bacterium]|nr:DMT family transporter [Bacteroidales bacterium]
MKTSGKPFTAYLALFTGLIFMSFSAVFTKLSHAPGIVSAFYRMVIGGSILFMPFIFHMVKSKEKLNTKGIWFALGAGACFGIDMMFWSTGIVKSNATIPTLFANTSPIWVGLGSIFLYREKHNKLFWTGIFTSFAGIVLLIHRDFSSSGNILFGAFMGLMASFFYSSFILISQTGRRLIDTLSFLFFSTLASAFVLFFAILIFDYQFTGYDRFTISIC